MSNPLIECQKVARTYQMGEVVVHALRGLDLTIQAGEFIILLGPSGSGKTTTLNLIGGLDKPSSGKLMVQGAEISAYSDKELTTYRRNQVGFIFQFFNLIPTLTAVENIEFALMLTDHKGTATQRAHDLLAQVGLADRARHFPSQLSGGEQQRVAIARGLANKPALLLCDEPTGNLDVETGQQVLQLLADLNQQAGTTVVFVTHNTALAPLGHRVIRLRDGDIDKIEINAKPATVAELVW